MATKKKDEFKLVGVEEMLNKTLERANTSSEAQAQDNMSGRPEPVVEGSTKVTLADIGYSRGSEPSKMKAAPKAAVKPASRKMSPSKRKKGQSVADTKYDIGFDRRKMTPSQMREDAAKARRKIEEGMSRAKKRKGKK